MHVPGRPGAGLARHHRVGGQGERPDRVLLGVVDDDVVLAERRLRDQLATPLAARLTAARHHEGVRPQRGDGHHGEHRLARAARQDDHAVAPGVEEGAARVLLVRVRREDVAPYLDLERRPVAQAGLVVDRPAELQERLLHGPAIGRGEEEPVRAGRELVLHPSLAREPLAHHGVAHREAEARRIGRVIVQAAHAVALHAIADLVLDVRGELEAADRPERGDDLVGGHARRGRVPQREVAEPIGVHVLGRLSRAPRSARGAGAPRRSRGGPPPRAPSGRPARWRRGRPSRDLYRPPRRLASAPLAALRSAWPRWTARSRPRARRTVPRGRRPRSGRSPRASRRRRRCSGRRGRRGRGRSA